MYLWSLIGGAKLCKTFDYKSTYLEEADEKGAR